MSRYRRSAIIAVCSLIATAFVWFDHNYQWRGQPPQPTSREQAYSYDFPKYHGKTFKVVKVVDGDTLDIDIPDANYTHTRIRLLGIDTPETKNRKIGVMYYGPQASDFAKEMALGKDITVYLDTVSSTRDKYKRLLAYIQLQDGNFLNEVLVSEGFAYADLRFKHSYYKKYTQLGSAAQKQKKGLWQNVTRDQLPEWLQREKPKLLNK